MNLKSALAASLFAIAAVLSFNASAVSDTPAEIKTEKPDAMKKMRPHSHLEEKLGITAKTPEAKADEAKPNEATPVKVNPALDKTKHYHPRDGGKL